MPNEVIEATTVDQFKNRLDEYKGYRKISKFSSTNRRKFILFYFKFISIKNLSVNTKKAAKKSMCYFIVFNKMNYTDSKMVKTPNIQKNAFEETTLKEINGGTFF